MVDGVRLGPSISLIYIAHATVIICHSLRLYGLPVTIAEITLCWGIMIVCPSTVFLLGFYLNVAPFESRL
jgi:hypothetical protein